VTEAASPEQAVAQEVRAWRNRRNLTAQELADKVTELGGSMSRQAISKLENGDRKITLDELGVLAAALGVPPVLLVIPLGKASTVELYPGSGPIDAWKALTWWTGEFPLRQSNSMLFPRVLRFFREHHDLVNTIRYNREAGTGLAPGWVERLQELRKNMRRAELIPPELPLELADIPELPDDTMEGDVSG